MRGAISLSSSSHFALMPYSRLGAIQSVAPPFGVELSPVDVRDVGEIERGVRARKLDCLGNDRGQRGLEIKGGVDRPADLAERLELFDRLREFARARLHLVEPPHVLDGDDRLIPKGLDQFDLLVGKRPDDSAEQVEHPNRDPPRAGVAQRATCDNRLSSELQIKCTPDQLEHR